MNRQQDPISAARHDIVGFQEEVARNDAAALVNSICRANQPATEQELAARCGSLHDHSPNGLLEDNEVDLAFARAYAQGTIPVSPFVRIFTVLICTLTY